MTDLVRAIRDKTVFKTSADVMVRDYIHPEDFHQLVDLLLTPPPVNGAIECYSRAPVDKLTLLKEMGNRFGLRYEIAEAKTVVVNATGAKPYYYSTNRDAAVCGYKPKYTSLEGVIKETELLFPK